MKHCPEPASPVSCAASPQRGSRRAVAEHLARLDSIAAAGRKAEQDAAVVRHMFLDYTCPGTYDYDRGRRMGCGEYIYEEGAEICRGCARFEALERREATAKWLDENQEYAW